jgi:hypothetical protein
MQERFCSTWRRLLILSRYGPPWNPGQADWCHLTSCIGHPLLGYWSNGLVLPCPCTEYTIFALPLQMHLQVPMYEAVWLHVILWCPNLSICWWQDSHSVTPRFCRHKGAGMPKMKHNKTAKRSREKNSAKLSVCVVKASGECLILDSLGNLPAFCKKSAVSPSVQYASIVCLLRCSVRSLPASVRLCFDQPGCAAWVNWVSFFWSGKWSGSRKDILECRQDSWFVLGLLRCAVVTC